MEFWTEISGNFGWMDRAPGVDCMSQVNHNPFLAYSLCKTCMDLVCRPSTCNIGHFFEIWELSGRSRPSDKWGARSARPWDKGGGSGLQKIFFRSFGPHFGRKIGGAGPQSSEISQTIVYKILSNFANSWSHIFVSFQQITFKICIFANLKALLLAVSQSRVGKNVERILKNHRRSLQFACLGNWLKFNSRRRVVRQRLGRPLRLPPTSVLICRNSAVPASIIMSNLLFPLIFQQCIFLKLKEKRTEILSNQDSLL